MAYCCLILLGKSIQKIVFGELRISEQQVSHCWRFLAQVASLIIWLVISVACSTWKTNFGTLFSTNSSSCLASSTSNIFTRSCFGCRGFRRSAFYIWCSNCAKIVSNMWVDFLRFFLFLSHQKPRHGSWSNQSSIFAVSKLLEWSSMEWRKVNINKPLPRIASESVKQRKIKRLETGSMLSWYL